MGIISKKFEKVDLTDLEIEWTLFADNAPSVQGKINVKGIEFIQHEE